MSDKWVDDSEDWREGHSDDDSFDDHSDDEWSGDSTEENDVIECPKCGCDVYEYADQCPLCGEWFTRKSSPWDGKPTWWVWLGVAGIAAVIFSLVFVWC